jgi:hypothetical protein
MMYKLYKTLDGREAAMTVDAAPQISFIFDPANTDYQAFLRWCDEGGVPEPADEVTE